MRTPEEWETDYLYDLNDIVTEVRRDNGKGDIANAEHKMVYAYDRLDHVVAVYEYYGSSHGSSRAWEYEYDKEDRLTPQMSGELGGRGRDSIRFVVGARL